MSQAIRSGSRVRAAFVLVPLMCAVAGALRAQSISPPVSEYREKASASFTVTNESVFPLTVVLQPRGFTVSEDGEVSITPLDTTRIHLSLSTISFRLQPRQAYTVFYDVKADSVPAWFTIWNAVTGARTSNGVNIRVELPHVVYLNQKERLTQADVRIVEARWLRAQKQVVVELENTSRRLGRAQELVVTAPDVPAVRGAAFPSFPQSRRRATLPWAVETAPAKIEIRFDGFKLESGGIVVDDTPAATPASPPDSARAAAPSDSTARP